MYARSGGETGHTGHKPRWLHPVQDHITGHLSKQVANKQDGHQGVILTARQFKVLVQPVEFSIDHGISIKEVQKVHQPKDGLAQGVSIQCYHTS